MKSIVILVLVAILLPSLVLGQWVQTNGPYGGNVISLAINSSGHIFAGTCDCGVLRSTDNGDNWSQTGFNVRFGHSLAITSSGYIFAGTWGGGVFRSTNNGDNWTQIDSGLNESNVSSLAINSSGHIFAGTYCGVIYRSGKSTTSQ